MKTSLLAAMLLMAAPAAAQPLPSPAPVLAPGAALLNVSAEAVVRRAPDLAMFSAGVVTQAKTAGEAMAANARRMDAVVAALKRAGVADRDIQTASLNLQPQYYYPQPERPLPSEGRRPAEPRAPQIIGYEARNSVQVRVRRLGEMGRVIDALVDAGANQVDGPSFTLDDQDAALDEARAEAVRKARARAELYARAAGLRVARILSISEGGAYYPQPAMMRDLVMVTGAPAAPPPPPSPSPVAPGELQLGVTLSVQFALER
jgi:uncharacterized protein YggE